MHKSNGLLPLRQPLFVHQIQHGSPDGRGQRRAADQPPRAIRVDDLAIAHGADVRVGAAAEVEHAALDVAEVPVLDELRVGPEGQAREVLGEVAGDGAQLVQGRGEDVGEAAAGGEARGGDLLELLEGLGLGGVVEAVPLGAADGEHVGAGAGEVDLEDVALGAVAGARVAADAGVARRHDDGGSLQRELHPLVALALDVEIWEGGLVAAVGDGDHVGGLVDATLELALVAARVGIGILGVETGGFGAVAGLSEGTVCAVAAINGVEEGCELRLEWWFFEGLCWEGTNCSRSH